MFINIYNIFIMRLFTIKHLYLLGAFVLSALLITSCGKKDPDPVANLVSNFDKEVAFEWNETFLEVERYAAGYRPGPAPRALAYIGLAQYEACITGMPDFNSVAGLYVGLSIPSPEQGVQYYWPAVINASNAYLMKAFFVDVPADKFAKILETENYLNGKYAAETDAETFDKSVAYGKAVATAVWNFATTDLVGHDHYKDPFQGYTWEDHFDSDGDWKPTFPGPGKPMGGVWGNARTFAITEADKICTPPLEFDETSTSKLYAQALEVYSQNTPTLSYEDEWIGEFWSDDLVNLTFSPGPRWLAIGNQILDKEGSNLETAVFMNVKVGMALNDAAVACWKSKYYYNVERPQTYINRVIDPNWKPALFNPLTGDEGVTPSFPAYPSGHSTMGGAGAEVLASIFGYDYALADRCHENRNEFEGTPRSFGSLYEMAQENAWSRVPLGVHFRMDSEVGVQFGTEIGRIIDDLPWKD